MRDTVRSMLRSDKFLSSTRFGGYRTWTEGSAWGHNYLISVPADRDGSLWVEVNVPETLYFPVHPAAGAPAAFPLEGKGTYGALAGQVHARSGRRFESRGEVVFDTDSHRLISVERTLDLVLPVAISEEIDIHRQEKVTAAP